MIAHTRIGTDVTRKRLEEDLSWARRDVERGEREERARQRLQERFKRSRACQESGKVEKVAARPRSAPNQAVVSGLRIDPKEAARIVEAFERAMSEDAGGVRISHVRYV